MQPKTPLLTWLLPARTLGSMLVLIPSFWLFSVAAVAETLIFENTTWTTADSPIERSTGVRVAEGVTLTVEPGVDILFCEECGIRVEGTLVMRGTESDPITVGPSEDVPGWGSIEFVGSSTKGVLDDSEEYVSGSILEYVQLTHGTANNSRGMIHLHSARPVLRDLDLSYSRSNGIYVTGVNDDYTLARLNITNTERFGIWFISSGWSPAPSFTFSELDMADNETHIRLGSANTSTQATGVVRDSVFQRQDNESELGALSFVNNYVTGGEGGFDWYARDGLPEIHVTDNVFNQTAGALRVEGPAANNRADQTARFERNLVLDNSSGFNQHLIVRLLHVSKAKVLNNLFVGNYSTGRGGNDDNAHVEVSSSTLTVESNLFYDYDVRRGTILKVGRGLYSQETHAVINNTFYENRVSEDPFSQVRGITLRRGERDGEQKITIQGNTFQSPTLDYDLETLNNSTEINFSVASNYWPELGAEEIDARILDNRQNSDLQVLDETPRATEHGTDAPLPPPANLTVSSTGAGQVDVSWDPPAFGEATGYRVYWGKQDAPWYDGSVDVGTATSHALDLPDVEGTIFVGVTAIQAGYDADSNDPDTLLNETQTSGEESWYARAVANPLDIAPEGLSFGELNTGDTTTQTLTVENRGYSVFQVTDLTVNEDTENAYQISNDECSGQILEAGEDCTFTVTFAPSVAGEQSAEITLTPASSSQAQRTVAVAGEGIAVPRLKIDPVSLDFGAILLTDTADSGVELNNVGTATLSVSDLSIQGAEADDFLLDDLVCTSVNVGAGCSQKLTFTPLQSGQRTATLEVKSDDPDQPDRSVSLQGVGVQPVSIGTVTASTLTGLVPLTVEFNATASGGKETLVYDWDLGDGQTGSGQTLTHTFTEAGDFTVALAVDDPGMADNSAETTLQVSAVAPPEPYSPLVLERVQVNESSGVVPFAPQFEANVSGGSGQYDLTWDFGDGTTAIGSEVSANYDEPGTYPVALTVTDQNDSDKNVTANLQVIALAPGDSVNPVGVSAFSASSVAGVAPHEIDFVVEPSGGSGEYLVSWDFGEGNNGDGQNASHLYTEAGDYTVTVTVTDAEDDTATASGSMAVSILTPPEPLGLTVSAEQTNDAFPAEVLFTLTVTSGQPPFDLEWQFGDGADAVQSITDMSTTVTHQYEDPGVYQVAVSVTSANGAATQLETRSFPLSLTLSDSASDEDSTDDEGTESENGDTVSVVNDTSGSPGGCTPGSSDQPNYTLSFLLGFSLLYGSWRRRALPIRHWLR